MKKHIKNILIFLRLWPKPIAIKRHDIEKFQIQEELYFEVYWKILDIGKGPTILLKWQNLEIMKFDCFGHKDGHYHIAPYYDFRIYYVENTAREQITRSTQELMINAKRYLKSHPNTNINQIEINEKALLNAVTKAEKKMLYFLDTVPQFQDI